MSRDCVSELLEALELEIDDLKLSILAVLCESFSPLGPCLGGRLGVGDVVGSWERNPGGGEKGLALGVDGRSVN